MPDTDARAAAAGPDPGAGADPGEAPGPEEVLAVAKAIWDTDPRNLAYSDADLRRRVWEQDKPSYQRLAVAFLTQLRRQGYALRRDGAGGPA